MPQPLPRCARRISRDARWGFLSSTSACPGMPRAVSEHDPSIPRDARWCPQSSSRASRGMQKSRVEHASGMSRDATGGSCHHLRHVEGCGDRGRARLRHVRGCSRGEPVQRRSRWMQEHAASMPQLFTWYSQNSIHVSGPVRDVSADCGTQSRFSLALPAFEGEAFFSLGE